MTQTALLTGATKGIGFALAELLARKGVKLYATGRDELALAQLKDRTGAFGAPFDLAEREAPRRLYQDACDVLGQPPDFLINNAGFNSRKAHWIDVTDEEFDTQYAVNLRAPALLCRSALADMAQRAREGQPVGGHIVNVVSSVVHLGIESMAAYSTMKQGLHGLTRVLIKEGRAARVKVTGVYPGGTDTAFREAERPEYMRPESVAEMIGGVLFSPTDVVVHELTFRPFVETNF